MVNWIRARQDAWFLLVAVAVLVLRFYRAGYPILCPGDNLRLTYEALLSHRGMLIYRDFFEFSQPGLIFYFQAWGAAAGFGILQMNVSVIAIWLSLVYCTWFLAKRHMPAAWAAIASALAYICCFQTQPLYHACATGLLLCAAAVVTTQESAPRTGTPRTRLLVAGLLTGLAALTMQSRGAMGAVVIAAWVWRNSGKRAALKHVALFAAGIAIPVAALAGYFWSHHALADWLHCTVPWAISRPSRGTWAGLGVFAETFNVVDFNHAITTAYRYGTLLLTVGIAAAALRDRRVPEQLRLLALLTFGQFAAVLYGPEVDRLIAGVIPAFIILCWYLSQSRSSRALLRVAAVCVVLVIARQTWHVQTGPYALVPDRVGKSSAWFRPTNGDFDRYRWVLDHTRSGEVVAFYPWENDLLFLGDLRNPAKFIWLDEGGFNSEAEIASVVHSLRQARPKLGMWTKIIRMDGTEQPIRWLKPLRDELARGYVPVAFFPNTAVLQMREGGHARIQ